MDDFCVRRRFTLDNDEVEDAVDETELEGKNENNDVAEENDESIDMGGGDIDSANPVHRLVSIGASPNRCCNSSHEPVTSRTRSAGTKIERSSAWREHSGHTMRRLSMGWQGCGGCADELRQLAHKVKAHAMQHRRSRVVVVRAA